MLLRFMEAEPGTLLIRFIRVFNDADELCFDPEFNPLVTSLIWV